MDAAATFDQKPTMAKKKTVATKKKLDLSSSDDDKPKKKPLKMGAKFTVNKKPEEE